MVLVVGPASKNANLYFKNEANKANIDSIIENIIKENSERDVNDIRALVKETLVAKKKELKLSDKQINKIIAGTNIEAIQANILKSASQDLNQSAASIKKPSAGNYRAIYMSGSNVRTDANAAADYYERYNAMPKAEGRLRTQQAYADAKAAFNSKEYTESITERPIVFSSEKGKPTKTERKLKKQNIDANNVISTPEQINREERQRVISAKKSTQAQEAYVSSSKQKAQKILNEQISANEHNKQRRPGKSRRNAEFVTSQGQMTRKARKAYNEAKEKLSASRPVSAYVYPESGVNWSELYSDAVKVTEEVKPAITDVVEKTVEETPQKVNEVLNDSIEKTSDKIESTVKEEAQKVADKAENTTKEGAKKAEELLKKYKKMKWVAGIAAATALVTGFVIGHLTKKDENNKAA